MSFVNEISNKGYIIRDYRISQVASNQEALTWLKNVCKIAGIRAKYFYFSDNLNRSEEGSESIKLGADSDLNYLIKELNERHVDYILLHAAFDGKPVVIGIDLSERVVRVTSDKSEPLDFAAVEQRLNLLEGGATGASNQKASSNGVKNLWMKLQSNVLGGAKVPHSTSQPVIRKENGKYYLAVFTFFYNREDIQAGMVSRPTVWDLADLETGEIVHEYETMEKDFSDATYDVKYNVRADAQYDTSKEYYDKAFAILDSVREKLISTGKFYNLEYQIYLDKILANIPKEYQRFYRDLSV